jgi:acyl-CoA thioesterase
MNELNTISQWQKRMESDQFAKHIGVEMVEAKIGYARVKMEIKPYHLNGVGIVHGGAIFTMADFAFAIAANSREQVAVAINVSIAFVKAVSQGTVYAEAREISINRKLGVYQVDVIDESKELLASFQGMAYRKRQ